MVPFFIFLVLWYLLFYNKTRHVIDGKVYTVERSDKSITSANLLANMNKAIDIVIKQLAKNIQTNTVPANLRSNIERVIKMYPQIKFSEYIRAHGTGPVAFNENKQYINLCLQNVTPQGLLYVGLHEVAHCGTIAYDPVNADGLTVHSHDFSHTLGYMYTVAESLGVLDRAKIQSDVFCGQKL